jgi:hypothetical protein
MRLTVSLLLLRACYIQQFIHVNITPTASSILLRFHSLCVRVFLFRYSATA